MKDNEKEKLESIIRKQRRELKRLNEAIELRNLKLESLGVKYHKLCIRERDRKEKQRQMGKRFSKMRGFLKSFRGFYENLKMVIEENNPGEAEKLNNLKVWKMYNQVKEI